MQIKGYSNKEMSRIALGTHLGDANDEVSASYRNAIKYAVQNGIYTIDGAINYRGMRSEKDEGIAIRELIESGIVKREDIVVTSKAGLLFGDITERMNPKMYLENILKPQGITESDFSEYDGLRQTLNPAFYEIALNKSLENLGLETLDLHYIHIPEITRAGMEETVFYDELALMIDDPDHSQDEERFIILGMSSKANLLIVCHCYRASDTVIRIISARKATKTVVMYYG